VTAMSVEAWHEDSACRAEHDPDIFFSSDRRETRDAKAHCASCLVRETCLEGALTRNERFGVWGGLTTAKRDAIRRERRRHAGATATSARPLVRPGDRLTYEGRVVEVSGTRPGVIEAHDTLTAAYIEIRLG